MALKTLGSSIINIYHSHILPIILLTGMKFCYSPKKFLMFIYINAGATVGDNICASSTPAVTFDSHYDHRSSSALQQRLRNEPDAEQIAENSARHLNQLINVHSLT